MSKSKMGVKVGRSRTYNPTTEELSALINEALVKDPEADWRNIHGTLSEKKPGWKLPERRIAKFVKRAKSGKDGDDKSITSTRSMGSFRQYFRERSSRKAAQRSYRKTGASQGMNDDDSLSVSSRSSIRKLFARGKGSTKKLSATSVLSEANSVAVDGVVAPTESQPDHPAPPLSPPKKTRREPKPRSFDDDLSITSTGSIRRFFKERKARKATKKILRNSSKPIGSLSSGQLLPPIRTATEEEDLDVVSEETQSPVRFITIENDDATPPGEPDEHAGMGENLNVDDEPATPKTAATYETTLDENNGTGNQIDSCVDQNGLSSEATALESTYPLGLDPKMNTTTSNHYIDENDGKKADVCEGCTIL